MPIFAMAVFGASLLGIIGLFTLKRAELVRGMRFAEPLRLRADTQALRLKALIARIEWYLERTPWFLNALMRYGIHVGALSFARLARTSAEQAHRLADFVSHKHRFEKRETKSDFLKKVTEHKNGDGNGVATSN